MRKTDASALFAAYPHIRQLDELWGTRDGREFITRLLNDTRDGTRRGFPSDHAKTIVRLLLEHDRAFPQFEESISMLWHEPDQQQRKDGT
jgi:hypothetical protein